MEGMHTLSINCVSTRHAFSSMGFHHFLSEIPAPTLSLCSILFRPALPYSHGNLPLARKIHLPSCLWPRYLVDTHKSSFVLPFLAILSGSSFRHGLLVLPSQKHPALHFLRANYLLEWGETEKGKTTQGEEKAWINNFHYHPTMFSQQNLGQWRPHANWGLGLWVGEGRSVTIWRISWLIW